MNFWEDGNAGIPMYLEQMYKLHSGKVLLVLVLVARWCWCRNTSISTNTRRLLVIVACELRDKPANLCFEVRTGRWWTDLIAG